jgi:hypothetical protein
MHTPNPPKPTHPTLAATHTSKQIDTLESGEIDYDHLASRLAANVARPAIINVNIGTTVKGAVDDLDRVLDLLEKTGVWLCGCSWLKLAGSVAALGWQARGRAALADVPAASHAPPPLPPKPLHAPPRPRHTAPSHPNTGYSQERFYVHCDGALFGMMMPFIKEVSHAERGVAHQVTN